MGREIEPILTTSFFFFFRLDSLLACRDIRANDLTELPPGVFDSLALLEELYVFSFFFFVVETSFVPSFLEPDTLVLFLRSPWPSNI